MSAFHNDWPTFEKEQNAQRNLCTPQYATHTPILATDSRKVAWKMSSVSQRSFSEAAVAAFINDRVKSSTARYLGRPSLSMPADVTMAHTT